jgi:hypothetical protein
MHILAGCEAQLRTHRGQRHGLALPQLPFLGREPLRCRRTTAPDVQLVAGTTFSAAAEMRPSSCRCVSPRMRSGRRSLVFRKSGLSHERSYVAGAESFYSLEGNMCGTVMRGADALPGSKAEDPKGSHAGKAAGDQAGAATAYAPADPEQGKWLGQVVRGYFNYHAVPTNAHALAVFRHHVTDLWRRTLRRRSQKDRMTWERMTQLVGDWLPEPIILRPWPSDRFAVTHLRWEPYAGKPLASLPGPWIQFRLWPSAAVPECLLWRRCWGLRKADINLSLIRLAPPARERDLSAVRLTGDRVGAVQMR